MGIQQQSGQGDPPSLQQDQAPPKPLIPKLWQKQSRLGGSAARRSAPQPQQQSPPTDSRGGRLLHEDAFDFDGRS